MSLPAIHAITHQDEIFVSPVNIAELQMGAALLPEGPLRQRALRSLKIIRRKSLARITDATAVVFGDLAATLRRSGRSADFRINDLWLAAQCIQRGFTLLTSNEKDFRDIPGLKIVALPSR